MNMCNFGYLLAFCRAKNFCSLVRDGFSVAPSMSVRSAICSACFFAAALRSPLTRLADGWLKSILIQW